MRSHRPLVRSIVTLFAVASTAACVASTAEPDGASTAAPEPKGKVTEDFIRFPIYFPDLTVWGSGANGVQGIEIANWGAGNAGAFRVAVLDGAGSYSIDVAGLAAGKSVWYPLKNVECCEGVSIIVDVDNVVAETNENNNSTYFYSACQLSACQVCNDGSCQCAGALTACTNPESPPTEPNLCGSHGGIDPSLGCVQESEKKHVGF
jgi:hypothetical protein